MRKSSVLILFLFVFGISKGQIITKKNLEIIKNSKIVVAQYDDSKAVNQYLKETVEEFWNFSEVIGVLPVNEALDSAKNNGNFLVLYIAEKDVVHFERRSKLDSWNYRYVPHGRAIKISDGKKSLAKAFIPIYHNAEFGIENFIFGISTLQNNLESMDKNGISYYKLGPIYRQNADKIVNKTLLVPEGWLDNSLDQKMVDSLYQYKAKVVSYEDWQTSIKNKDEESAYLMLAPVPVDGGFNYKHFIVDCETASICSISLKGTDVEIRKSLLEEPELTYGKSGYVTETHIEEYNSSLTK